MKICVPAVQGSAAGTQELIPLAIFDDAHELHPDQFQAMERILVRRELRIARWIIARFDALFANLADAPLNNGEECVTIT